MIMKCVVCHNHNNLQHDTSQKPTAATESPTSQSRYQCWAASYDHKPQKKMLKHFMCMKKT